MDELETSHSQSKPGRSKMITLFLTNGTKKCFNLNNNKREEALYSAWYSMSDVPKFADKTLKITTHANELLSLKVSEIQSCKYEDCTYFDNPEVKNINDKEEHTAEKVQKTTFDYIEEKRKENMTRFYQEVEKIIPGVTFKPDDPLLMEITQYVTKDFQGKKIHYYARLYADYHKKVYFQ